MEATRTLALLLLLGCTEAIPKDNPSTDGTVRDSGESGDPDDGTDADGGDSGGDDSGDDSGGDAGDGTGDTAGDGDSGDGGSSDGGSGDGGSGDGGETGEEEPPPALPLEGSWSLTASDLVQDDCGVATYQDPDELIAETWEVSHVDASTFALSAAGEPPGDCGVVDGVSFSCEPTQVRQDLSSYGFAAEMVVDTVFSGELGRDWDTMSGPTDIVVTCEGDCWLVELVLDFPCDMRVDLELAAD